MRDEIASLFIALLSQTPELQTQIVNSLYVTLRTISAKVHLLDKQETLIQVSAWCIGEYADMIHLDDVRFVVHLNQIISNPIFLGKRRRCFFSPYVLA